MIGGKMKKFLLAVMLVLAMMVPVFAQDAEDIHPEQQGLSIGEQMALLEIEPITYKKMQAFDVFTSQAPQFSAGYSPVSAVYPGEVLYGHIQWEFDYRGRKDTVRIYTMNIKRVGSFAPAYKDTVTYPTIIGEFGERWQAFAIPTADLGSGYYTMQMQVKVPGLGTKTLACAFRIY
jgi:hypothetical protein